jgi:hypothetical protein
MRGLQHALCDPDYHKKDKSKKRNAVSGPWEQVSRPASQNPHTGSALTLNEGAVASGPYSSLSINLPMQGW